MSDDLTQTEARRTLAAADASTDAMRRRARWTSPLLGFLAAGFAAMTLVVGLVERPVAIVVLTAAFLALSAAMVVWALRQPAVLKGMGRRFIAYWTGSIVLYVLAPLLGRAYGTDLRFWVPAAVLVALPTLVGALRERRA